MSAADVTAVIAIGAALAGGIWLMLTDSTRARQAEERDRRYYEERLREMEENQ